MALFFYTMAFFLLFSGLLDLTSGNYGHRFTFALIRFLVVLPMLVFQYLYSGAHMTPDLVGPLFFSESVFGVTVILMACSLQSVSIMEGTSSHTNRLIPTVSIIGIFGIGILWKISPPPFEILEQKILFSHNGQLFYASVFMLIATLFMAWRSEGFWRALPPKSRWLYKYLMVAFFLIGLGIGWSAFLRLTYRRTTTDQFLLLAFFLTIAWCLIIYSTAGNRLLNRKIFISRKVVYRSLIPLSTALYLFAAVFISLAMKIMDRSAPRAFQWVFIITGLLLVGTFTFSRRIRLKVKYFISTHFYINKYEYRDEWLAFSDLLHRNFSEEGVVAALKKILSESLYTDTIEIWLGDTKTGFRWVTAREGQPETTGAFIMPDDPLICLLQNASLKECKSFVIDPSLKSDSSGKTASLSALGVVLLTPLSIGGRCMGLIGLGPEYSGERYGRDDYDLLTALGSQAASALIAARAAEELACAREQSAFNTISAFVLHDIKNAAAMLSLVKENAPRLINNPDFQRDMLETIEDAMKRMAKVQYRLKTFNGEIVPILKELDAELFLKNCCSLMTKKFPGLRIDLQCFCQDSTIRIDTHFFSTIVENLILNALEAGNGQTRIRLKFGITKDRKFRLIITDNGPGIPQTLLPDRLFDPFITSKKKGSGIGLWQAKQLIGSLGGKISAQNVRNDGAQITIQLPA